MRRLGVDGDLTANETEAFLHADQAEPVSLRGPGIETDTEIGDPQPDRVRAAAELDLAASRARAALVALSMIARATLGLSMRKLKRRS